MSLPIESKVVVAACHKVHIHRGTRLYRQRKTEKERKRERKGRVRVSAHVALIALPIIARDSRTRDDDRPS